MKEFIEYIAKNLVDKPNEVLVTEIAGESTTIFELRVNQGDIGKIIGKRGQTVRSIRVLIAAALAKQGKRSVFQIIE